jgi:hypothetical protein
MDGLRFQTKTVSIQYHSAYYDNNKVAILETNIAIPSKTLC